jgi:hypothetical protein
VSKSLQKQNESSTISDVTHTPTIDVTKPDEPVEVNTVIEKPPRITLANASSTPSLVSLMAREPVLFGSQNLREEMWNSKEARGGGQSEDSVSVASDISSASKKPKKKTFFSFGRKKDKQKEITM